MIWLRVLHFARSFREDFVFCSFVLHFGRYIRRRDAFKHVYLRLFDIWLATEYNSTYADPSCPYYHSLWFPLIDWSWQPVEPMWLISCDNRVICTMIFYQHQWKTSGIALPVFDQLCIHAMHGNILHSRIELKGLTRARHCDLIKPKAVSPIGEVLCQQHSTKISRSSYST